MTEEELHALLQAIDRNTAEIALLRKDVAVLSKSIARLVDTIEVS